MNREHANLMVPPPWLASNPFSPVRLDAEPIDAQPSAGPHDDPRRPVDRDGSAPDAPPPSFPPRLPAEPGRRVQPPDTDGPGTTPATGRHTQYTGWRRAVHHLSAGSIDPGRSPDDLYEESLIERIRQPLGGNYRMAVLSLKGGVGKTTTTVGLGSAFASLRNDRVIAVDANPDLGTLAQRVQDRAGATVRDLLRNGPPATYDEVRALTAQAATRLEVLGSDRDPAVSEAFDETEYREVITALQRFYNIILTDCGTGLMHSAMSGALGTAHSLALVSSPAIDGARSAAATLDWLELHGYGHLIRNAVVVISSVRPGAPNIHMEQMRQYFLSRCRAVQVIPFDWHLSEGAGIDQDLLHAKTRRAFLELAATVADDFHGSIARYNSLRH